MMGFAFGAIAGWGPGYVMGKGALAGRGRRCSAGSARRCRAAGTTRPKGSPRSRAGPSSPFSAAWRGAILAGALVAVRVPRSLILAGGAALALVSWLVFLAAR
jgi:hypothetical protein